MRVAIFASGNGSNFEVLAKQFENKCIPGELVFLFSDQKEAYVLKRAKRCKVPYYVITKNKEEKKELYEERILQLLTEEKIDLIVLAGYMKIISKTLLEAYPNRIINIHPSLLPKFPGKNGIHDFFSSSENKTGITIHLVDSGIDTGPVIFQKSINRASGENLEELEKRIHELEHTYYPKVITDFIRERTKNGD